MPLPLEFILRSVNFYDLVAIINIKIVLLIWLQPDGNNLHY